MPPIPYLLREMIQERFGVSIDERYFGSLWDLQYKDSHPSYKVEFIGRYKVYGIFNEDRTVYYPTRWAIVEPLSEDEIRLNKALDALFHVLGSGLIPKDATVAISGNCLGNLHQVIIDGLLPLPKALK